MNYFDEARSIQGMLTMRSMTQNQLAELLSVSQPYIANKLRLLRYTEDMQKKISEAGLTERHARTLLRLEGEQLDYALDTVIRAKMTTAATEALVDRLCSEREQKEEQVYESDTERLIRLEGDIERSLRGFRLFGTKAKAKRERIGEKIYISICIG